MSPRKNVPFALPEGVASLEDLTSGLHTVRREIDNIWSILRDACSNDSDVAPETNLRYAEKAIFEALQHVYMVETYVELLEHAKIDAEAVAAGRPPVYSKPRDTKSGSTLEAAE